MLNLDVVGFDSLVLEVEKVLGISSGRGVVGFEKWFCQLLEAPVVGIVKGWVVLLAIFEEICHVWYGLVINLAIIYTFEGSIGFQIDEAVEVEIYESVGWVAVELGVQSVLVIVIFSRFDESAAE